MVESFAFVLHHECHLLIGEDRATLACLLVQTRLLLVISLTSSNFTFGQFLGLRNQIGLLTDLVLGAP
jgi:hypothetical protein